MAKPNPLTRNKKKKAEELYKQRALIDAKLLYQQVCQADKRDLDSWVALGSIHGELGELQESVLCFDHVTQLNPNSPEAHFNLAKALRLLGQLPTAEQHYRQALKLHPGWIQALNNLGNLLHAMGRSEEATNCYQQALSIQPNYLEAKFNYANLMQDLGRYPEAIAVYRELLTQKPDHLHLLVNLARALAITKKFDDSFACYDRVLALISNSPEFIGRKEVCNNPYYVEASYTKSLFKLLLGEYEEGWRLYEWRWKTEQLKNNLRQFKQPLWLGDQPIAGKTILLHAEQGLGDTIQFVRYVSVVERLGANVVLEVPATLISLVQTFRGSFNLIAKGDDIPPFDLHCPLMSLPHALRTTLDTIPADIPYLAVDAQRQAQWRERLGTKIKPRIGLVWSGNVKHLNDRNRSIALRTMEPLLRLDFEYHSLQKEIREEDKPFLNEFTQIQSHENELNDFSDTAALIAAMDLVITVDTSVAHLAGALGKPVWILLPYSPDFRWLLERGDSPWYPTARLFRQRSIGDWDGVVAEVLAELKRLT
jgi:hypothetical protein